MNGKSPAKVAWQQRSVASLGQVGGSAKVPTMGRRTRSTVMKCMVAGKRGSSWISLGLTINFVLDSQGKVGARYPTNGSP